MVEDKIARIAKEKGLLNLLDCDYLRGKVPYGEYWWWEKFSELTGLLPAITIYECIELCPPNFLSGVELKDERRVYVGPKYARVPRGSVVRLVVVVNGKTAIFEWRNEETRLVIKVNALGRADWITKYAILRIRSFLDEVEING